MLMRVASRTEVASGSKRIQPLAGRNMHAQRGRLLACCAAELLGCASPHAGAPGAWLRWLSAGPAARLVHSHTAKERRDFPTQLATLDDVRGVLRLAGSDLIHFLQVPGF